MADEPVATPEPSAAPATGGTTWRGLLRAATIASILVLIAAILLIGFFPPLLLFPILWGIGLWRLGQPGRFAPILLIVAFVFFFLLNAPFIIPQLTVPASTIDFILGAFTLVLSIVGIVASIAVLRGRDATPTGAPRAVGAVIAALMVITVVTGVVARVTFDSAVAKPGDIELTAEDFKFSASELDAGSGEVAVIIKNNDTTLHTFTIDGLDVDTEVPAGTSVRVTFDADPGTYRFYCRPHETDMHGELNIR